MVPLALESCEGKCWKLLLSPVFGCRHRAVDAPQSGPYHLFATPASTLCLQLHSVWTTTSPSSPTLPVPRLCSFPKHRDTDISWVTRMCVVSVASVQIHINGRREKKLCPTFWDDPPQRKIQAMMFLPLNMLSLKAGRSSNLQLCFSPIH